MKTTPTIEVKCPKCGASYKRSCVSSRIPSANTLGGGWGGPPALSRSHPERVQARKDYDRARTSHE